MRASIVSPRTVPSHSRLVGLFAAALLLFAVLFGALFTTGAQAAVSYSEQEIAFVNLLNDYRVANGLSPLLVSDMISEACDRHNSDMAKYKFFDHYSLKSDWFETNASPWTRMSLSGYGYSTSKGENIAAGQVTAAQVFAAWKASSGHNANMLNSAFTVLGVSLCEVAGSPYTFYWTTDFGGYTDPTAHTVTSPSTPTTTRYQQAVADSKGTPYLTYAGTWATYSTSKASGGSYKRACASGASVTLTFEGTYLAWIATKGTTLGKAFVSVDGGAAKSVDLAAAVATYQQRVWTTGTLSSGRHTVKIWRDASSATGKYINVDAVDVAGTLVLPQAAVSPVSTRYEQNATRADGTSYLVYAGTWATYAASGASARSYMRANTSEASVTVTFTGTGLAWIATAGTTLGKAYVSLDGGPAESVDLARSAVAYQQNVWNTGTLASGQHTVKIWWNANNATGKYISIDAVEVQGALN